MQKSFVRQTRSKTRATEGAATSRSQPTRDDGARLNIPEIVATVFEPSLVDIEHGDDNDCAECRRPNSAELYMVQCGCCKHWYHFSCAKVDTVTARSSEFVCAKCKALDPPPPASTRTGRSSGASSKRMQIARDLQRLEEERNLRERLEDERMQNEKLLVEKAMREKLEREKEYLDRKHELLRQQDEEALSMRSSRSSRSQASSRHKVEAWFDQQQRLDSLILPLNQKDPEQVSANPPADPVGSSTPVDMSKITDVELQQAPAGIMEAESVPRTTDSISIGESPGTEDDFRQVQPQYNIERQPNVPSLPLVNLQPFIRLLEEANPTSTFVPKPINADPRIVKRVMGPSLPYAVWQRETSEMRKQHAREQQCPEELEEPRNRHHREQELVDLLKRSEEQREQDRLRMQEIEAMLTRQHAIEKQHQKENDVRRKREMELINQLKLIEQQYMQEKVKRDEERQSFLAKEQHLTEQLDFLRLQSRQPSTAV